MHGSPSPFSLISPKLMEHSADGFRGFRIVQLSGFAKDPVLHCYPSELTSWRGTSSFLALPFPKDKAPIASQERLFHIKMFLLIPTLASLCSSKHLLFHTRRFLPCSASPGPGWDQAPVLPSFPWLWESLLWIFASPSASPARFSCSLSCVFRIKVQLVQFLVLINPLRLD